MNNFINIRTKVHHTNNLNHEVSVISSHLRRLYGINVSKETVLQNSYVEGSDLFFNLHVEYWFSNFNYRNKNNERYEYSLPELSNNLYSEFHPLICKAETVKSMVSVGDTIQYVMENGNLAEGVVVGLCDNWLAVANSEVNAVSYIQVMKKLRSD